MAPTYSVIVPAYNEAELLPSTLAALRRAMEPQSCEGEVVVVDNNSTDDTAAIARAAGARVVFEPHNQIARARNAGGRAATGEWLVFVDADSTVSPALLTAALTNLASGRCCGGSTIMTFDEPVPGSVARCLALMNWMTRRKLTTGGAFLYCTRRAFDETGGFWERLYATEEFYFFQGIRRWGRRHDQDVVVLAETPVVTSSRKVTWFGPVRVLMTVLAIALFPPIVLSQSFCRLWYRRPADE